MIRSALRRESGRDVSQDIVEFLEAEMPITDRIELNPNVMMGKPVIRGTRITVELILRKIAEGADEAGLLAAYPTLSKADIQAVVTYATDALAQEKTVC